AAGSMTVEVNAHGRVIDERPHEGNDPVQGETAVLTIDAELQAVAMKELEGESGAAVVMDVKTGEVLVMASSPAFDPNDFNVGINAQKWRELNASPYKPLLNKPLSGTYPPGSTFKMITAIAALEAGMSPNERINCSGRMYFGNRFFHCWKKEGHGPMNMRNAIKHSCDVYFYQAAIRAGVDRIASVSHRLGLGEIYPFDVPGQEKGIIPSTDWKLATLNERWYKGETLSVGIGQGYVNTNPMQLAVMTARLATGRAVKPWITRSLGAETFSPPEAPPIDIDPKHLAIVQGGMDAVTNEGGGTAWRSRLDNPDWRLAGKTGTSQVRRITKEERARGVIKNEDLPWHRRDHALFVAYAPYEDPRYAISVVVEHGGSGSKAAGPRAREIMKAVMAKDPARMKVVDPTGASGETAALPGDKARQG
ncbi:MAG: penicillin-binding protein 2, partial [Pseudomonadota bacterium]